MNVLEVSAARRRFDDILALDGVSLTLGAGELLALLGPNGAGKTTLVRAIAGRVRLDEGTVSITDAGNGQSPAIGLVPQEIAIYPLLTARENLAAFGRFCGLPRRELARAVDWALEWTGLAARADERAGTFSGGMKRRLNIACGVLHRPRLVLLDEPTVGVDPQSRERIYEMLATLRGDGAALLLTTHQLDEAEARCDRVVVLDRGRVIAAGTVGELVERVLGSAQTVTVALDPVPDTPPSGLAPSPDGGGWRATVADVARDLPVLLQRLAGAGFAVTRLDVRAPGLAQVFLELTGRELRE